MGLKRIWNKHALVFGAAVAGAAAVIIALVWPVTDLIAAHDVGVLTGVHRTLQLQAAREAVRTQLLTLGAGVFAAGALVYTARNFALSRSTFRATEVRVLNERFVTIAAQLGDDQAAVRLAGIHAMAGLADDWEENRQTCIDVLCAYLRMPYVPDPGKDAPAAERLAFGAHREVRHTIIRVIAAHLRAGAPVSWQRLRFDFTGVVFDGGDFSGAEFSGGRVSFDGAEFFGGEIDFSRAKFCGDGASFSGVKFSGAKVGFNFAEFSGRDRVVFDGAEFSGGSVDFDSAKFPLVGISCDGTEFSGGKVSFNNATFSGIWASFGGAEFSGGLVDFGTAKFTGGGTDFSDAKFSGAKVSFYFAEFSGRDRTDVANASVSHIGSVDFSNAMFSRGEVDFSSAQFTGAGASFREAEFTGSKVDFTMAGFSGGTVSFSGAKFSRSDVSFYSAKFSGGAVDFSSPGEWSHPPMFSFTGTPPPGVSLPEGHAV